MKSRPDIARKAHIEAFERWILSSSPQRVHASSARSFRRKSQWCWNVPVPRPDITGEVYPALMIDGTYFGPWCVLIAYDGTYVRSWQWCHSENEAAYLALLEGLAPQPYVVIDGNPAAAKALKAAWEDVVIQRCLFHIRAAIRRHLTTRPKLAAGKELLGLTRELKSIATIERAHVWHEEYLQWEARWETFLNERTYAKEDVARPGQAPAKRSWWYTHQNLRKSRYLYRQLLASGTLFAYLTYQEGTVMPRATSALEGHPNKAIKDLLRAHRGLPAHRARIAVDWLLNSLTEHPHSPWDLARPEH